MPSPPTHVTVIIVTYQSAEHIAPCLQSLPASDPGRSFDIHIIDNASTDGTVPLIRQVCASLCSERVSLSLICNAENVGFTHAVNQGLQLQLEAAAVLFLNPDTILTPGSVATLMNRLYADDNIGVVAPQLIFPQSFDAKARGLTSSNEAFVIQPSCRRFPTHSDLLFEFSGLGRLFPESPLFNRWKMGEFDHRSSREVEQPQGACLLARPEVVRQIGAWDERFPLFFSDVDWCRRVWQSGWKIRFEPDAQVIHVRGASVSQARPAAIWSSHRSFWRYLRKYGTSPVDRLLNLAFGFLLLVSAIVRLGFYYFHTTLQKGKLAFVLV